MKDGTNVYITTFTGLESRQIEGLIKILNIR